MYATFFGLRELPFNNTPDPRFFFATPDHEEALASLVYAVQERKGCVLLTGEVGAGKTLVTRLMLRHFGSRIVFAHVHHAIQSAADLMESVCAEFEIDRTDHATPVQRVRALHDFLLRQFSSNIPAVLLLDEAQNLPVDAFEQLRMIGNLEADDAKLLQMVIVGQPELRRAFASHELRQLRQRIFRAYHLGCMDLDTTVAYLRHRLQVAGATSLDIFDASACNAIHHHARGLPRVVNTICDNAMLSAYAADHRSIDGSFVESVVSQMMTLNEVPEPGTTRDEGTVRRTMPARTTIQPAPQTNNGKKNDPVQREAPPQNRRVRFRKSVGSEADRSLEKKKTARPPKQTVVAIANSCDAGPLGALRQRLEVVLGELGRLVTRVEGSAWRHGSVEFDHYKNAPNIEQPITTYTASLSQKKLGTPPSLSLPMDSSKSVSQSPTQNADLGPQKRTRATTMDRLARLADIRRIAEARSSRT
ncbi:MAG: AAA family ATPase [Planctomycetota bacterium]